MTEQEEDEELLSDLNTAKKTVISFDESPNYIKVSTEHIFSIFGVLHTVYTNTIPMKSLCTLLTRWC